MIRAPILVTGATGKTGAAVVAQLRQMDWPVRAIVRGPDTRSERLDRLGAETVVADLYDPDQLVAAMHGTARAYYCPPLDPFLIQSAAAFAVAARQARLEAVVGLGQWLASPPHPAMATRQSWLADYLFAMLPDVAHVIVNPGFFADNYLRLIGFAAHLGVLPSLTGDGRNAPPSNEDIARVAVAALIDPDRHAGRSYRPTRPTLLSTSDVAAILGQVPGRSVRRVELPMWLFVEAARMQGVSAFQLHSLRDYVEDHRQRAVAVRAPTNHVREVTGLPAEDFAATARRYAALPEARRNAGRTLRAVADFMRTLFAPGYDLDRLARENQVPVPPQPRFALRDPRWTAGLDRHVTRAAVAVA